MFCQSCGAEYAIGLNYCNRCGANLNTAIAQTESVPFSVTKPAIVIGSAVVLLTLLGFTALIEGAAKLALVFQQNDPVVVTIALGMITIMVIDLMLVLQLSRLISAALSPVRATQPQKLQPHKAVEQLSPPTGPMPSITEHTTRTLEPAFRQPIQRS
ncbi:MAG TPA: hypothetical protein DHU55_03180 [Blastocatellia bacterium]|jgi:hypothetical protein|nr:hypothetical protein [Blastocatellia bacterium]HAF24434.1 hypothetical protein [Blastocatellia bacterium]HCX28762.1 hypothetical protein [Blastocatellia bacterium]